MCLFSPTVNGLICDLLKAEADLKVGKEKSVKQKSLTDCQL